MNINDIVITSLETITAFDVATGDFKFVLDELQNATIANSEDKTEITGKQGRRLSSLKRNKAVTISGSNGMVSGGLFEVQTGSDFINKETTIMYTDYLTVSGNAAETTYKGIGAAGAEIVHLYVKAKDGTLGKELTQVAGDSTLSATTFTYAPGDKALKFSGLDEGTEIVVYYKRKIKADVLENVSDHYSGKCALYIDALAEDKCSNVFHIQFYVPKADFNGTFSFEMGDSQTVHSFEAEAMAGACNGSASLWTYTIFGANAEDVA